MTSMFFQIELRKQLRRRIYDVKKENQPSGRIDQKELKKKIKFKNDTKICYYFSKQFNLRY